MLQMTQRKGQTLEESEDPGMFLQEPHKPYGHSTKYEALE